MGSTPKSKSWSSPALVSAGAGHVRGEDMKSKTALYQYGKSAATRLDQWARGFVFGVFMGIVFALGFIWALQERLK